MKINTKSLLYGTMILSLANFTVRLLGFVYRVILSRMIGPQGMGLVQLVYPVFQIAITLTVAGIPIAVSRLISEKNVRQDIPGMRRIITTALLMVTAVSTALTLAGLFNLNFIAGSVIKDMRTKGALFILFPNVILIGLGATLKGFFYGGKHIHPPALAEIIEQLMRMTVSVSLIFWLAPGDNYSLAAMLVMLGTVIGELSSLLFLHTRYYRFKKELLIKYQAARSSLADCLHTAGSLRETAAAIAAIALPITSTRLINSLMSAANSVLIPQRLVASGMLRDEAVGLFGILFGMVMPLMFLPFTITNALTVVIIPNLSESLAMKRWKDIQNKTDKAIRLTCYIAFPSIALLTSLGRPIGTLLYKQPLAGTFLIPASWSLLFLALQHTCSGILNGLGRQVRAAMHFMAGSTIQLLCTYFLLANPAIRIWGVIIGFTAASMVVSAANMTAVLKATRMSFKLADWILKPGFAALLMGFTTAAVYKALTVIQAPVLLSLIISALTGFLLFMFCLWAVKALPAPGVLRRRFLS
ncbi:MAG TPA: polysaccharide biosynthesis protein [Clostridiales bacterium]|nr:polysaccharide biosynthesis protein [Clostridiales bacterium]